MIYNGIKLIAVEDSVDENNSCDLCYFKDKPCVEIECSCIYYVEVKE